MITIYEMTFTNYPYSGLLSFFPFNESGMTMSIGYPPNSDTYTAKAKEWYVILPEEAKLVVTNSYDSFVEFAHNGVKTNLSAIAVLALAGLEHLGLDTHGFKLVPGLVKTE